MHKDVKDAIKRLGGKIGRSTNLLKAVLSIQLPSVCFEQKWEDYVDTSDLDHMSWEYRKLIESDRTAFRLKLKSFMQTEYAQQRMWGSTYFTPFTPGTDDYNISNDEHLKIPLKGIKDIVELVGGEKTQQFEFIQIMDDPNSESNYEYYLCLQDPSPENPSVFYTDNFDFFDPIKNTNESLSEFLNSYFSIDEVIDVLEQRCLKIYEDEVKSFFAEDDSDVKKSSSKNTKNKPKVESYEEIKLDESDIENLLVEIDNILFDIEGISESIRKVHAKSLLSSFCKLMDQRAGTELNVEVKRIIKEHYRKL